MKYMLHRVLRILSETTKQAGLPLCIFFISEPITAIVAGLGVTALACGVQDHRLFKRLPRSR